MKNNLIFFKWRNSYFFGAVFSSEQLLFGSSYFFRTVISSQQLLFQNSYFFRGKLVLSSYFLRIDCSLGRLLFRKTYSEQRYIQKSFLSEASNLSEQLLIQQSYFFKNSYFFRIAAFLEELLLETVNFSGKHNSAAATFSG